MNNRFFIKKNELLYLILLFLIKFFSICIGSSSLNLSESAIVELNNIYSIILIVLYIGLVLKIIIYDDYTLKSITINICICIFLIFLSMKVNSTELLLGYILIISAKKVPTKKIIFIYCLAVFIGILVVNIGALTGIMNNIISYRNGEERYSLGFSHVNTAGRIYFEFYLSLLMLRYKKINYIEISIGIFLLIFLNSFTDSRSGILAIALTVLLFLIFGGKRKKILDYKIIKKAFVFILIAIPIVSIILMIKYRSTNSFMYKINELMTYRINFWNSYYKYYGTTLFGSSLEGIFWVGDSFVERNKITLDNIYVYYYIKYGIILFLIYFIGKIKMFFISLNTNYREIALAIIILTLYGFVESSCYLPINNIVMLLIVPLISQNNLLKKKCEVDI